MDYGVAIAPNAIITIMDGLLVSLCPLCGALGGYVARHLNLSEIRKSILSSSAGRELPRDFPLERAAEFEARVGPNPTLVGGILGLVVALYFVGAITEHVTSLARVLALCILLGYQAPNLWRAQEKILGSIVEERLRALLGDKNLLNPKSNSAVERDAQQAGERPPAERPSP